MKMKINGCASVFNVVDQHNECVLQGAFLNSIDLDEIKMKYEHDLEIDGKWEVIREKSNNQLWVEGYITKCKQNKELINKIEKGEIKGLSIGCYVKKSYLDIENNIRYFFELTLNEISLVEKPANLWANFMPKIKLDIGAIMMQKNKKTNIKGNIYDKFK